MNGSKAWISNCFHPFISSHPWHHHHHLLPSENHHPFHNIKVCNFTQAEHLCKISSALYLAHPNQNFRKRMSKFSFLDSILLRAINPSTKEKSKRFILRKDYFLIITGALQVFVRSVKQLKSCFILKLSHVPYTELATQMDLQTTTTTHYSSSPFSSLSEISYEGIIFALPAVVRFYHRVSWIYFLPKLIS